MVIGTRPAHRIRYALVLGAVLVLVTAVTFIPLGVDGAVFYYQHVLLPSLASNNPDCAYDSVRTLFMRTIGGEPFLQPTGDGYRMVSSPLHLSGLALALSYSSAVMFAAGAAWAAWRSGWNPAYGMAVGFSLGALIPNEVWPYQWLPLLPTDPPARGAGHGAATVAHPRHPRRLPARVLPPALRPVLSEPVDRRRNRSVCVWRYGKIAFSV